MLLQTAHLLKTEMVWQGPDGYNYADRVLFSTQCCFYTGNSAFHVPKSSLPEVVFLILLLPEYGSLIDTTIADRYRYRLFIESAYTIGGKR